MQRGATITVAPRFFCTVAQVNSMGFSLDRFSHRCALLRKGKSFSAFCYKHLGATYVVVRAFLSCLRFRRPLFRALSI